MFLYAQIYWLAEFGDVSCLQFNYLRVETLTPIWILSLRPTRILSDDFKSDTLFKSDKISGDSKSDLRVWALIHFERSVSQFKYFQIMVLKDTYLTLFCFFRLTKKLDIVQNLWRIILFSNKIRNWIFF
jgi:hypothetical protein